MAQVEQKPAELHSGHRRPNWTRERRRERRAACDGSEGGAEVHGVEEGLRDVAGGGGQPVIACSGLQRCREKEKKKTFEGDVL